MEVSFAADGELASRVLSAVKIPIRCRFTRTLAQDDGAARDEFDLLEPAETRDVSIESRLRFY